MLSTAKGLGTKFSPVGPTKVLGLQVFYVHLKVPVKKNKEHLF